MTDREKLADYAHDAWSRWMKYMFLCGYENSAGQFCIDADMADMWRRKMSTDYADLTDNEKISDLAEADRIIEVLGE